MYVRGMGGTNAADGSSFVGPNSAAQQTAFDMTWTDQQVQNIKDFFFQAGQDSVTPTASSSSLTDFLKAHETPILIAGAALFGLALVGRHR